MDSPLTILTPQTSRADRLPGRGPDAGAADAGGDPGGFARMMAAASIADAPGASAVPQGSSDAAAGAVAADTTKDAATPVSPLLLRALADARTDARPDLRVQSQRGEADASRMGARGRSGTAAVAGEADTASSDAVDPAAEASKPLGPERADAAGAAASPGAAQTSLMQWMLQMAPQPPAPVPAQSTQAAALSESARVGLGRQDGDSLLQSALPAGLLGRPELAGREVDDRGAARGARSARSGAPAAGFSVDAGAAAASAVESPALAAALPRESVAQAAASVGPTEFARPKDSAVPKDFATSTDIQALQPAAAQAAAATLVSTVSANGSPVVAPAQTWIQTPVTQPGFSDEVVVEMVRRVGQAEQGTQSVTLHLNPVELGPVSVSIELTGSAARIEFGASEALTRHHLEAALPGLAEALRDEGVSLTHGGVHEASKESLAIGAAGGQASGGSGGAGSDTRQRGGEAFFDGRSGYGERAPRREAEVFSIDGRAVAGARAPDALGQATGRAGRLDLFA
jgi:flagellar hook-length control protein FliK